MDIEDVDLRTDEEDQRIRSTKKVMLDDDGKFKSNAILDDAAQEDISTSSLLEEKQSTPFQSKTNMPYITSYKNTLLGINGADHAYSSEDLQTGDEEDDYDDSMQEDEEKETDPLCPEIPITTKERKKLCRP